MKIGRCIMVFEKHGDALIDDIDISNINIDVLKELFESIENDPEYYAQYEITKEKQYSELVKYNSSLLKYDFKDYFLSVEAHTL